MISKGLRQGDFYNSAIDIFGISSTKKLTGPAIPSTVHHKLQPPFHGPKYHSPTKPLSQRYVRRQGFYS